MKFEFRPLVLDRPKLLNLPHRGPLPKNENTDTSQSNITRLGLKIIASSDGQRNKNESSRIRKLKNEGFSHHRSNNHQRIGKKKSCNFQSRAVCGRLCWRGGGRGTWARSKATVYLSSEVRGIVRRSQYINSAAYSKRAASSPRGRLSLASASCKCFSACYRYLHKEGMMYAPRSVI